ncbi:unnamed protein product [Pylaiella littoralis]
MMRVGGTRGTMEQCLAELEESPLPASFKLTQVRSLLRYIREVGGLVKQISSESGFEADTTAYLEILCAKEDSNLLRRVSDTRILKQDFDEKRREWRRTKKNVINAISEMSARALKFECGEKKTIALHAIQFYKNVMASDDGAIPGESESTDGLIDQYRRHRDEISKIPFYADSIMKMLKDIRRTVSASAKLQPGSNAFTQFLDEWWASVVDFLQHSPIVDAERNAREVMQTLKKLKGKQEENKKREMSRLMNKLEAQDKVTPPVTPASELVAILDDSINPEDTVRWNDEAQPHGEERSSLLDGDTEHDYDGNDEGLDELSELGRGGVDEESQWSESSPTRSEFSPKPPRQQAERGHSGFAGMSSVPDNVGSASVASWDARSEPTLGTDGGTDQDIAAASGLPEDESEDSDDEEDDDFEVADSLDLGAVALCATGTGADGQQTYQDAARTPQAMRHMTNKLGVEQQRFSAALDYFRQEQRAKGRRPAMPPPPPGPSRSKTFTSRGRETRRTVKVGGRRLSGDGGKKPRPGVRDVTLKQTNTTTSTSAMYRSHSLYISSSSSTSSTRIQGSSASTRQRINFRTQSRALGIDHES